MKKAFACILLFLLIVNIGATFGLTYPTSSIWDLQKNIYLSFDQSIDLVYAPQKGLLNDISLVGYWSMNENTGSVASDYSGNGNNGTITGAQNSTGKYGLGLYLNGVNNSVLINSSATLQINSSITMSAWIKVDSLGTYQTIIDKSYGNPRNGYYLSLANNRLLFGIWNNGVQKHVYGLKTWNSSDVGIWHHIVGVFDGRYTKLYVDGIADGSTDWTSFINGVDSVSLMIGHSYTYYFSGIVDEVRIYNRALTSPEVKTLYLQPDNDSLVDYYNYKDSLTNNVMLIHVDSDSSNSTIVNCTAFFTNTQLIFITNNSALLNIWTNLGKPVYSTGVWNSRSYTTTLSFNASSIGILDWNAGTPPFASNISTTSNYAGNTTIFSALWSDNQSLFSNGYIFSTNNTGHWVNSTWTAFTSSPTWGNATLTLNSAVGVTVGFREYANNTLNIWGDSGIYTIRTTSHIPASSPTPTPAPSAKASPIPTSVPTSKPYPTSTPTPTPSSIPDKEAPVFSYETRLIVASTVIVVMFAIFVFAFKKGYITIQLVDEQTREPSSDYPM